MLFAQYGFCFSEFSEPFWPFGSGCPFGFFRSPPEGCRGDISNAGFVRQHEWIESLGRNDRRKRRKFLWDNLPGWSEHE
jgi:hypothetical protein